MARPMIYGILRLTARNYKDGMADGVVVHYGTAESGRYGVVRSDSAYTDGLKLDGRSLRDVVMEEPVVWTIEMEI
jgi:hypothetical protein